MRRILCLAAALLLCLASCTAPETVQTEFMMDTVCTIRSPEGGSGEKIQNTFLLLRDMDARLSREKTGSEIWTVNRDGGGEISPEAREIIEAGIRYGELSDGLFDITIAPVKALWDFTTGTIPEAEALAEAVRKVDFRKIRTTETGILLEEGMGIDLGGIAKGYCADRAAEDLRRQGITQALIDLGGNIACIGTNRGKEWRVGLRDPFGNAGEVLGVFTLRDGDTVTTSGTYERFFEKDGKIWHHILDPRTGKSAETDLVSATIICPRAIDGDALSTIAILLGSEKAMALVEDTADTEAILVLADGSIRTSSGFANGKIRFQTGQTGN
ncbi:MAG: FAD:protein FMN transferase [Clostridia bacterium]|nr:FAD:protein FMN transferase [Clostridia bacterium]